MAWKVETAQRKMKNGKEAGNNQVNIETLKAGEETLAKQLVKLYTKCITERRIPKTWTEANMVIFFKKGNRKDTKNYRPICLLLLRIAMPPKREKHKNVKSRLYCMGVDVAVIIHRKHKHGQTSV